MIDKPFDILDFVGVKILTPTTMTRGGIRRIQIPNNKVDFTPRSTIVKQTLWIFQRHQRFHGSASSMRIQGVNHV
jgi:hypothetical protein